MADFSVQMTVLMNSSMPSSVVRLRLPQHLKSRHSCKDDLIEAIISSDNIQFLWSMLSADMDGDAIACEPLEEIVKLWVTVRSFSTVSAWVEQYKEKAKTNARKSKALRKTLAQNQQAVTESCNFTLHECMTVHDHIMLLCSILL